MKPLFVTIPHSGEKIPAEVDWLSKHPEEICFCDVDRFVDQLYKPALDKWKIPAIFAEWHRYVADLNRLPEDVDVDSVEGSQKPSGTHSLGLLWSVTTKGQKLMDKPISAELHKKLVSMCHAPFHQQIRDKFEELESEGYSNIYHLDAHSMPSVGTSKHNDPGETRAEIVISDVKGKSCRKDFKDLVIKSYEKAGFQVVCNWPYYGGRITQVYGQPQKGHHTIQIEMSRSLYMDEDTKKLISDKAQVVQKRLVDALGNIMSGIDALES